MWNSARAQPATYSRLQIALHWLVAALIVGQYATSGAILRTHSMHALGWRPSASDLVLHTLHNRVGLAIIVLMIGRLALRLWFGVPAPLGARGSLSARLAQGVHFAFYAVLITEGMTGAIATYFWWPISAAHTALFWTLLALFVVHLGGALLSFAVRPRETLYRITGIFAPPARPQNHGEVR